MFEHEQFSETGEKTQNATQGAPTIPDIFLNQKFNFVINDNVFGLTSSAYRHVGLEHKTKLPQAERAPLLEHKRFKSVSQINWINILFLQL